MFLKHPQLVHMRALMWHVYIIQDVSTMLGQIQKWVPHLKTRVNIILIYVRKQFSRYKLQARRSSVPKIFIRWDTQNFNP